LEFQVIELKVISTDSELSRSEIEAIARLHVSEMAETLTSIRGEATTSNLYRRLLDNEGRIVLATESSSVIGVLSYTVNHSKIASLGTMVSRPLSWLRVISKKGMGGLYKELNDAYSVARKVRSFDNRMLYVTTLFVDSSRQNQGIATLMFEFARKQSTSLNLPVVVDTRSNNYRAIRFYERQGMHEFARTSMSVLLKS
jgi:ribosomal protein S18 acetylase RimI-like enzyme